MLEWANQFGILTFFDNNNYHSVYNRYECLLAVGQIHVCNDLGADPLADLLHFYDAHRDWIFGNINYDFKNRLEPKLGSDHKIKTRFPEFHFYIPETVCSINAAHTELSIETFGNPDTIYREILRSSLPLHDYKPPKLEFKHTIEREQYLETINQLRNHIKEGDCYEINFCGEGYCESNGIDPKGVFSRLNCLSPAPFAAYYRLGSQHMMCASPERYLRKDGNTLMSQPIKGTARRGTDTESDELIKTTLKNDLKERAENVMIVDLVRNDLARCCEVGSIKVDELFGIYTYPQVHQMISTVSGQLRKGTPFTDAIRYSFPMGSMTGAPKYKVMQLIEQYEQSRRELFSGTIGYINPEGDFDFNVVIRSLFYNATTGYLGYQTGGAITWDSQPEQEWEEMRLKAWALERIFMERMTI